MFAFLGYQENFVGTQKQVRISHGKQVNLVFELLGFHCIQISWLKCCMFVSWYLQNKYGERQAWSNNVGPDQIPKNAQSDQGLHC